jgi:hypothetical protein
MQYVDTGSRDPTHALGTWLAEVMMGTNAVAAMRLQTGFFGAGALGYFESAFSALHDVDGHTRLLVGSNDGETPRAAVEDLLAIVGSPRAGLKLGVVSFQTGFFHTKVFHFLRNDGSATAYVGSANLTSAGVRSQHVEAGIILDTKAGDPPAVLTSIADAVDAWFDETRPGLYPVAFSADLDALVETRVIGVTPPPRPLRTMKSASGAQGTNVPGFSLFPLVVLPPIQMALPGHPASPGSSASAAPAPQPSKIPASKTSPKVGHWSKKLPASDAQRKQTGNQSGVVAFTQGNYRGEIDQTTYFRQDLFGEAQWTATLTMTGLPMEVATVPMHVIIDGVNHGALQFKISHALNREHNQNNYTTTLHLDPITPLFSQTDMTGKILDVERYADGSYSLTIA